MTGAFGSDPHGSPGGAQWEAREEEPGSPRRGRRGARAVLTPQPTLRPLVCLRTAGWALCFWELWRIFKIPSSDLV